MTVVITFKWGSGGRTHYESAFISADLLPQPGDLVITRTHTGQLAPVELVVWDFATGLAEAVVGELV